MLRARYCSEALAAADAAMAEAAKLVMPLLIMHSPQDFFVDFAGSEKLLARAGSKDKELFRVPSKQSIGIACS